jgi:hypothetical protein
MSTGPSPAATSWIPIQGDPRERVTYWGTYEASRTYRDGDCVIGPDKVLYLCTKNGTTTAPVAWSSKIAPIGPQGIQGLQGPGMPIPVTEGRWLKGVGGVAVWSPLTVDDIPNALSMPTYGSDLPPSPVDGQEHILVDNYSNPTWSWRCRYNASSTSAYKWDAHGIPIFVYINGQLTISTGGWQLITSTVITVPRSGDYICEASCRCLNNAGAGNYNHFSMCRNGGGNPFGPNVVATTGDGLWKSPHITPFIATFARGDLIGIATAITAPPNYFDMMVWSIKPARIS